MRETVQDYALKFERGVSLETKLREKGFAALPSEKVRNAHFPSDFTDCLRKRYYNFKGVSETNPMSFQTQCTLAIGSMFDDLLVKMSMRAKVWKDDEWSFGFNVPGLEKPISGRMDIVIEEDNGLLVPAEVKTIKSTQFYDREFKWGKLPHQVNFYPGAITEPKLANVAQLMSYIYKLGVDYGYLIYFCKDNSDLIVHKIYWSEELWNDVLNDAKKLEAYLALDTEPPRPVPSYNVTFYKRDATYGNKGDFKIDKPEMGFPCAWKDADTGQVSFCKYFNHCWAKEILENPDASQSIKDKVQAHLDGELLKQKGVTQ